MAQWTREEIQTALKAHKTWLDTNSREGRQLVVHDSELMGADLGNTNLSRANLEGANLQNTQLQDADLTNANLERAILWYADLTGADLNKTRFTDDQLTNNPLYPSIDLSGARNLDKIRVSRELRPDEIAPLITQHQNLNRDSGSPQEP